MAYDFGSQTLGIKNPFKVEGVFYSAAGLIVLLAGIVPLLQVADLIKEDKVSAYGYAILGAILISSGVATLKKGLFALFRFFVGRSVPTSLAYNFESSEKAVAQSEKGSLLYDADTLHSMLKGRKNATFIEPQGWVGRLIHSIFPKLTFLPYPLRHLAQEISATAINMLTALVAYLVLWFVISSGLAGEKAQIVVMPMVGILLLFYLVSTWSSSARSIYGKGRMKLSSSGGMSFAGLLIMAILTPIVAGFALDSLLPMGTEELRATVEGYALFSAGGNLGLLLMAIVGVVGAVLPVMIPRVKKTAPSTDVAEWRDNFQESVHPNEIFINIENIVLANRRYKEVPNRVYREWSPTLADQSDGKGSFSGSLLIETQPEYTKDDAPTLPKIILTAVSALFYLITAGLMLSLGFKVIALINQFVGAGKRIDEAFIQSMMEPINAVLFMFFAYLTFRAATSILRAASHLFWGEMHFNSLLMYMKTEGTYTESKVSTGMSIHDSTRSENTVVRSSITPWVMTARLHTSTFATTGSMNLESPRFILSMAKNDEELESIKKEIRDFLKGRESIASITNERDLANVSTIHQVNQQTRAVEMLAEPPTQKLGVSDEEAGGYLRMQEEAEQTAPSDR